MKHLIATTNKEVINKKDNLAGSVSATLDMNLLSMKSDGSMLIYDLLCRDEPSVHINLTDEEKKDRYLVVIATTLSQLVARGDKMKVTSRTFRSASGRLPPIALENYIARLLQYAPCDKECFLTALVYMDRLHEKCGFIYNSMNIHRSYLIALMLAAKFFEDQPCDNGYFATVGGVSVQEINSMELSFLGMLDFRISITGFEFNLYAQVLEAKADSMDKPKMHCTKEAYTPDATTSSLGLLKMVS